jgi:proline iminopeptidase
MAFTDLRHFAPSDPAFDLRRITFDTYADDIDRVRAALGFERFVIAGHSKHGNIALEYAKRFPGRVSHVVLIGSPPCGLQEVVKARADFWESHASEARKTALRLRWDALSPACLAALSPAEAEIARYVADGPKYWYDPNYDASPLWQGMHINAGVLDKLHGLFQGYELSWNLTDLQSPVLVVTGHYDFAVPHVLWDEQLPRLENVTYQLFERSGHTPQLEEQELFDNILLGWLQDHRPWQ